jgi:mRNA-degrading endonuclease RelE of RelBE toxin-antitoxin system
MQVEASDAFERALRSLLKRYRSILDDLQPLIETLENNQRPGDKIPNTGFDVYKVRIKNSDISKGKSGGYRVIYYLQTSDRIILLTLYAKSDQANISAQTIRKIIHDIENS